MEDVCNVDTVRFVRVLEQCFQHREKVYSKVGLSLRREDLCSELHMTTKELTFGSLQVSDSTCPLN